MIKHKNRTFWDLIGTDSRLVGFVWCGKHCFLQEWLLRQVCASEAVEPVISSLVSVLLKGCQDASQEARLLCGECLGELGAVDPGRLDLSHTHTHGDRNTFVVGVIPHSLNRCFSQRVRDVTFCRS